jgi:hypothetical protein
MFRKSNLTNLEYRLLLFATSVIPLIVFVLSLIVFLTLIYEYFFPPEPTINFPDGWGTEPTLAFFRLLVIVSLFISSVFVFFKRISVSIGLYLLSFAYFIFWLFHLHEILQGMLKLHSEEGYNDFQNQSYPEIFLSYLNLIDILLLSFIVFLFLWHIKIVIQDYYRENVVVS